jgi:hypothetical protein
MYHYILCEFTYNLSGQFYQEVDEFGNIVRMTDLDGNTIFPEGSYCAAVIDPEPARPEWAN